jgi:hypothetical protein
MHTDHRTHSEKTERRLTIDTVIESQTPSATHPTNKRLPFSVTRCLHDPRGGGCLDPDLAKAGGPRTTAIRRTGIYPPPLSSANWRRRWRASVGKHVQRHQQGRVHATLLQSRHECRARGKTGLWCCLFTTRVVRGASSMGIRAIGETGGLAGRKRRPGLSPSDSIDLEGLANLMTTGWVAAADVRKQNRRPVGQGTEKKALMSDCGATLASGHDRRVQQYL